ncbi:SGNH/GDSL hydrolase family protein [Echinicola salinicaeni]|uniref:SGNH/GDSL hydrolase family protein n=1 Tax=Echinicola salinicaeni TaxID=2762757 RepID=UPI001647410C|nr:SGNH/GDSL hydrolase family protein [Echinicola salinicaeni]
MNKISMTKSIFMVSLLMGMILVSCNKEDGPPEAPLSKVLVIGNSITYHPPAPEVGWNNDWGMAASAADKDYVSVLSDSLKARNPDIEIIRENVYPFERFFETLDFEDYDYLKEFQAELLIIRLGENVNSAEVEGYNLGRSILDFADYLSDNGKTKVLITTTFWENPVVNSQIEWAAAQQKWTLVDITHLSADDDNMALGEYEHEGVSRHPNDKGMKAIANLIWAYIKK